MIPHTKSNPRVVKVENIVLSYAEPQNEMIRFMKHQIQVSYDII